MYGVEIECEDEYISFCLFVKYNYREGQREVYKYVFIEKIE